MVAQVLGTLTSTRETQVDLLDLAQLCLLQPLDNKPPDEIFLPLSLRNSVFQLNIFLKTYKYISLIK